MPKGGHWNKKVDSVFLENDFLKKFVFFCCCLGEDPVAQGRTSFSRLDSQYPEESFESWPEKPSAGHGGRSSLARRQD